MTYEQALNDILFNSSPGIIPGLSRIEKLLEKLGNPQNNYKIIHIAGTNGKGTVGKIIADTLTQNGFKTGLFSSPFVTDYTEQIQIDGKNISEEDFAYYLPFVKGEGSEFERLTALMYFYFSEKKVDFAVVECGMGGLEDSTNAIENTELCVLTSISVDHTNFLGNTVEEIAKHKAGIIKNNSKVVLYPNKSVEHIVKNVCTEKNATLYCVEAQNDFKKNNLETAKTALSLLGINNICDYPALFARQECVGKFIIDGSHNESSAATLESFLPKDENITVVIAMMKDKNCKKYIDTVLPYCNKIIVTQCDNARCMPAKDLYDLISEKFNNVKCVENSKTAIETARKTDCDKILVCGSFYLCREVRNYIL